MIRISRSTMTAMLCAAAVSAQFVGSKATRDALFLTSLSFTALPTMLIATSVCSILLVAAHTRWAGKIAPATLVPALFVVSGVLFLCEWLTRSVAPASTAVVLYLHVSGAGPLLASGFWLIATERFDPRTAKRRFGQIAGAGTLGGLLGGLLAERVAAGLGVPAMLLFLAVFQLLTAWLVRRLASLEGTSSRPQVVEADPSGSTSRSGLRVVAGASHLRHLVALVLLGTTSAALLEYLFKAKAVEALGPGDQLLRFFAIYYGVTSLITFILQALSSRLILERFGLALTTSTPSIALLAGSLGAMLAPGFGSLVVARGVESILRGSWFRAGYELFYTPIPAAEKRAAKSVVDVGVDRLGDAVGGGLVRFALLFAPAAQSSTILVLAMASSVGAVVAASRLNHWYMRTLEDSLVEQAGGGDDPEVEGDSTQKILLRMRRRGTTVVRDADATSAVTVARTGTDPEIQDILTLRSRDRERIVAVLSREDGLTPGLIPHAIQLLAWKPVADHAFFALRKVAEDRIGELTDALLDPNQDDAVRRRLARVFSVCVSQRAADGLMRALEDQRFDVRFQSARSLAAVFDKNPRLHVERDAIYEVVLREAATTAPTWESLAHIFTLLSLVLPREPLQIAFRSLRSDDRHLRGTALEYLEGILPPQIRHRLWPFLVSRPVDQPARRLDKVVVEPRRSRRSLTLSHIAARLDTQRIAGFGTA